MAEEEPVVSHVCQRSDRTWPLPRAPWVMRMRWSELLFAHWQVDPDLVQKQLPGGLTVDTFDGAAWVGVVPFLMSDVAPRWCPAVPGLSAFPELNVRTYVMRDEKPGVWFFSLDAANAVAVRVARATFCLPYMDASMSMVAEDPAGICYDSTRTHRGEHPAKFRARYSGHGDRFQAAPQTLEHWLTARYCLYSSNARGELFRGEIEHPPWTLRQASCEFLENTMGAACGFEFTAQPHLLMADPLAVKAWWPRRC